MAKIELIDPASIPGGYPRYSGRMVAEATEELKRALQGAKALKIALEPHERTMACVQNYRKAAKALGIAVSVRRFGVRTYHNAGGELKEEACELYICITKAAAKPTASAAGPRTVDTLARPPITIPAAKFEKTVLPGVEVSR
jgi:hypothetical protein